MNIKRFSRFLIILFLVACAVQGPPRGGPIDRTPPEIVDVFPLPGSTRIPLNFNNIRLVFSERMNPGSERNNLFISPPVKMEYEWKKWKILQITLKEPLKKDQTYVLTVGSGLMDLRKNKMANSFALAFSTGDSIDQGRISGTVFGLKPKDRFNVFAYRLSDTIRFDPFKQRPDYVSQTGEQGRFQLAFLKAGSYRILAVEDRNHNFLVDASAERFAIPYADVCLTDSLLEVKSVDLQLAPFDTIPPILTSFRPLFNDWLRLRFSEPLNLAKQKLNPILFDSLTTRQLKIKLVGISKEKPSWVEVITQKLDSGHTYGLKFAAPQDSAGNCKNDSMLVYFKGIEKQDTTHFSLVSHLPADSSKNVLPFASIKLSFNLPVDWSAVQTLYSLRTLGGDTVRGNWKVHSLFQAAFVPSRPLQPDSVYISELNTKKLKDFRGQTCKDTLAKSTFFVISARELGEISGSVVNRSKIKAPILLHLKQIGGKRLAIKTKVKKKGAFHFKFVPQGKYLLDGFVDLNGNGRFDLGKLMPFSFTEPFKFFADTISVRKRWETAGIKLQFPENQP